MATQSNSAAVAELDAATALLTNGTTNPGPTMRVYDGTPPARPDAALSGNALLSEHAMSGTPFAGAVDDPGGNRATATANAIADDTNANATTATGATFARLFDRDDTPIFQLEVGDVGTEEVVINNAEIKAGSTVEVNSVVLAMPEGTHP